MIKDFCTALLHKKPSLIADNEDKTAYHVNIGSYAYTTGLFGISSYVLDNVPLNMTAAAISLAFTLLIQSAVSDAVSFTIASACVRLGTALAEFGWEAAIIEVPAGVASGGAFIVVTLISILAFFGIQFLISLVWRKYGLLISIYNFDATSAWSNGAAYFDNAIVSGGEQYRALDLPAYAPPGSTIVPPGFEPVQPIEGVISYSTLVFENDSTFLEGLTLGFQVNMGSSTQPPSQGGFTLKYDLPRFGNNRIGLFPRPVDPVDYVKNGPWVTDKSTFVHGAGLGNITVSAFTDALSGASDNVYHFNVNIQP